MLLHVCHLSPTEVDELSFQDFLVLSSTAKKWMEIDAQRPRM